MKAIILLFLALPAYAEAPTTPPILVSGEERQAILDKFGELTALLEKQERMLRVCRSVGKV